MKTTDTIQLRGSLLITVRRRGIVVATHRDDNMIMQAARQALARLIAGDGDDDTIAKIGVGLNANGPSPDDTKLTGAFVKPVQDHDYPEPGHVRFNWRLETTEANGMAIREFGLITAGDLLFARKTRAAIEKDEDISLDGAWTIIF